MEVNLSKKETLSLTRVVVVPRKRICRTDCLWHRHRCTSVCVEHPVRPYPTEVCWEGPHRGFPNPWNLTCWRLLRPLFRNEYWRLFHSSEQNKIFNISSSLFSSTNLFKKIFFSVIFVVSLRAYHLSNRTQKSRCAYRTVINTQRLRWRRR